MVANCSRVITASGANLPSPVPTIMLALVIMVMASYAQWVLLTSTKVLPFFFAFSAFASSVMSV